ncbi:MAG: hypothetical protein QF382_03770, partial [Acidimicrobiales bacterium]|nr:hypothetical protein [Acidimicrobiales bacterium]
GGAEFAWWCTDDPLAFNEDRPVWKTSREEIVELVGEGPYQRLVDVIRERVEHAERGHTPVFLPHPQVRRRTPS